MDFTHAGAIDYIGWLPISFERTFNIQLTVDA